MWCYIVSRKDKKIRSIVRNIFTALNFSTRTVNNRKHIFFLQMEVVYTFSFSSNLYIYCNQAVRIVGQLYFYTYTSKVYFIWLYSGNYIIDQNLLLKSNILRSTNNGWFDVGLGYIKYCQFLCLHIWVSSSLILAYRNTSAVLVGCGYNDKRQS